MYVSLAAAMCLLLLNADVANKRGKSVDEVEKFEQVGVFPNERWLAGLWTGAR